MVEIEVVHPAGHPQQDFTHYRHVREVVRINRNLGVNAVRQRVHVGVWIQLDGAQYAIGARDHRQRLQNALRLVGAARHDRQNAGELTGEDLPWQGIEHHFGLVTRLQTQ